MQKWEYMLRKQDKLPYGDWFALERFFNDWGTDGWELVSVNGGVAYFKRPIDEAARNRANVTWSEDIGWGTKQKSLVELDPEAWSQDDIEKHFIEVGKIGDQSILAFRPK